MVIAASLVSSIGFAETPPNAAPAATPPEKPAPDAPATPPAPATAPVPPATTKPAAPPATAPAAAAPNPPPPTSPSPELAPYYYVEPPSPRVQDPPLPPRARRARPSPGGLPPSAPPLTVWEPPPPPVPRHVAPDRSLWVGARLGWFIPFGYLFAQEVEVPGRRGLYTYRRVPWRDYSDPGPFIEVDVGARLGRNYNVFALWEHAELARGDEDDTFFQGGGQKRGDTDFWGLGVRASSDADDIGFLSEIALGYRLARTPFRDGSELQMESGLVEARLGLGADIRLTPYLSLSPLFTFGVGTFTDVDFVDSEGKRIGGILRNDQFDGHGWLTFGLGAHFDTFPSKR